MSAYKSKDVKVGNKVITVEELGRKSLKIAVTSITNAFVKMGGLQNAMLDPQKLMGLIDLEMDVEDMVDGTFKFIDDVLVKMIPTINKEDLDDIRNSEMLNLVKAWVEVNFTGQDLSLRSLNTAVQAKKKSQK